MLSLLSPAKNKEVAKAAIQAGADAVYIGAPAFGARQAAGNSLDDIARLVQYARPYGGHVCGPPQAGTGDAGQYPERRLILSSNYPFAITTGANK